MLLIVAILFTILGLGVVLVMIGGIFDIDRLLAIGVISVAASIVGFIGLGLFALWAGVLTR